MKSLKRQCAGAACMALVGLMLSGHAMAQDWRHPNAIDIPAHSGGENRSGLLGDTQVDFLVPQRDGYHSSVQRFVDGLNADPAFEGFHIWRSASQADRSANGEVQIVYGEDSYRADANAVARTLSGLTGNRVCVTFQPGSRLEGLGHINVYLPRHLDLSVLAGGQETPRAGSCHETRTPQAGAAVSDYAKREAR